jgi:hypothetical protein
MAAGRVPKGRHSTVTVVVDVDGQEGDEEAEQQEQERDHHGSNAISVKMPP